MCRDQHSLMPGSSRWLSLSEPTLDHADLQMLADLRSPIEPILPVGAITSACTRLIVDLSTVRGAQIHTQGHRPVAAGRAGDSVRDRSPVVSLVDRLLSRNDVWIGDGMGRTAIVALRVLLVVIVVGSLTGQVLFLPVLAGQLAEIYPELAWLQWPLLAVVTLVILVAQIAVVAIWVLLAMVEHDTVFSARAFGWVDVIIVAGVVDAVLVLGVNGFLSLQVRANPPVLMLFLVALTVGGAALACLMVVMKGLLRKASTLQSELREII
jgi:hypothetical protein